jgi:hypothetical protein
LLGNVEPANLGGALSWLGHTSEHREESGFASSIVAQKTEKFTVGYFEVNPSHCMDIFVGLSSEGLLEVSFLEADDAQSLACDAVLLSVFDLLLFFLD